MAHGIVFLTENCHVNMVMLDESHERHGEIRLIKLPDTFSYNGVLGVIRS